ncbi:hypothetical protein GBAR_LOCUS18459 [Geodia barretti]|uniref:Uncharacterized protein n=1 Tax=Geodia barretti TaxID=519541 RepID=A0AA35WXS4_GEOBA|nr:hypothetical protein GBAR_LOCUS18459 [Geodia barretti]
MEVSWSMKSAERQSQMLVISVLSLFPSLFNHK